MLEVIVNKGNNDIKIDALKNESEVTIHLNNDIKIVLYKSPQGYVVDAYKSNGKDPENIGTMTLWKDDYRDEEDEE